MYTLLQKYKKKRLRLETWLRFNQNQLIKKRNNPIIKG